MTPRSSDRLAAVLSLLLLTVLAASAWWLADRARRQADAQAPAGAPAPDEPEAFVDGFDLIRVDVQGRPVWRMRAERALHFGDAGIEMERPRFRSLDAARPELRIAAERARSDIDGERTTLDGRVVLTRAGEPGRGEMRIDTERLLLVASTETATSELPVRMTQDASFLSGTGMAYDNINRRLRLDARVTGRWQPAPAPR